MGTSQPKCASDICNTNSYKDTATRGVFDPLEDGFWPEEEEKETAAEFEGILKDDLWIGEAEAAAELAVLEVMPSVIADAAKWIMYCIMIKPDCLALACMILRRDQGRVRLDQVDQIDVVPFINFASPGQR